jgi:hypothetical protein
MKRLARTIGALGSLVLPVAYGEVPDGTRVTGGRDRHGDLHDRHGDLHDC